MLKTTLFKWIVAIGSVSVLMAAGAMSYSFILLPRAPVINSWGIDVNCDPVISFTDKSTNEDGFRILFRPQGAASFTLIKALPASPNTGAVFTVILAPRVPGGMYDYRVEAFNSYGQMNDTVTVDATSSSCSNVPPLPAGDPMPFLVEPILVKAYIVNDCDVIVEYIDLNTAPQLEEDGLRIYRNVNGQNETVIANLPPAGNGSYLDASLPAEDYQYTVSAFKGNIEKFSNKSAMLDVPFDKCSQNLTVTPVSVTPTATLDTIIVTPKKLSCEWEAAADVFLRKGPDVGLFDRLIDVQKGKTYPIVGQSEDGQFWAVEVEPGVIGYITKSEKYSRVNGDCGDVSTLTNPEPPEVIPAATKKPGEPAGPAACGDGVDNDGDGFVDYNPDPAAGDPGCSSSSDTSE